MFILAGAFTGLLSPLRGIRVSFARGLVNSLGSYNDTGSQTRDLFDALLLAAVDFRVNVKIGA